MELKKIEEHWTKSADTFGKDIRATDRSRTKKDLETNAIIRAIKKAGFNLDEKFSILEAGCGTGHNCVAIAREFRAARIIGFDYIPAMIDNANLLLEENKLQNVEYKIADLLDKNHTNLKEKYDVIFTNRCLINLNNDTLQQDALKILKNLLGANGNLILVENPKQQFNIQNSLRKTMDLEAREIPEFNHFLDEEQIVDTCKSLGLSLVYTETFASLHDLFLYVLLPKISSDKIDYDHPLLEHIVKLSQSVSDNIHNPFGEFGQNKLYLFSNESA